jgi:hypothetical protein
MCGQHPGRFVSDSQCLRDLARAGRLDGILQAMAPTAQGMVFGRCSSPLFSFGETVTSALNGYKNGYNQYFRRANKSFKIK